MVKYLLLLAYFMNAIFDLYCIASSSSRSCTCTLIVSDSDCYSQAFNGTDPSSMSKITNDGFEILQFLFSGWTEVDWSEFEKSLCLFSASNNEGCNCGNVVKIANTQIKLIRSLLTNQSLLYFSYHFLHTILREVSDDVVCLHFTSLFSGV